MIVRKVPLAFGCQKVSEHKLHMGSRGCMQGWARYPYNYLVSEVVLAYDNGQPVGAAMVSNGLIGTYVRPSYRRQGIGKKLATLVKKHNPNIWACKSDSMSTGFYNSVGI